MTRINTNVPSLVAQNRLQTSNRDLQTALTRLSTGLRINQGADDPAGLIASEALRSEITSLARAITNTNRASQIIRTADSALGEVSSLLNDIRGLVVEAANSGALSDEEIAANQLQIDSSLEAINRIAQTTTFQGRKLLDGSLDFVSSASTLSNVRDFKIDQANLGASGQINVEVVIAQPATQALLSVSGNALTPIANASASTVETARTETIRIGGQDIDLTAPAQYTATNIVDDPLAGAGTVTYDSTTGVATLSADFTNNNANALVIQSAFNSLDGFLAVGATAVGLGNNGGQTGAAPAGSLISIQAIQPGSVFNNVSVRFVAGNSTAASYDEDQKVLTVTVDDSSPQTTSSIAAAIESIQVNGIQAFDATGLANASVDINAGLANLDTGNSGGQVLQEDLVFQLNGADGAETFNFSAGTSATQIADAVNLVSDSTGVSSSFNAFTGLVFRSSAYGSNAVVNLDVISEGPNRTFSSSLSANRNLGTDIVATVNGIEARGNANEFSINTSTLDLSLTVDDGDDSNFSFSITDGGALFQLGPNVTSNQQARLGISSLSTGQLGGPGGRLYELGSGQARSLVNDAGGASRIIDEVISSVTGLRGRLGAFQATTLESNLVSLNETRSNLLEAESSIRDADFANESANLTRAQILVQSGTNVLALANQNPQNVLSLLG